MTTSATVNLWEWFNPLRLAGPIFDKELRVASRRRRSYILRFVYITLLILVVLWFWLVFVRRQNTGTAVVRISRMAEAGKFIVMTIVWFQFVTAQILAAVFLSNAIGTEIRQRTLDALLVTPIGSVQIVLGKLLSRLLQLLLLLAISLPLLASVRVFGGVPWDYVVLGLCVTLTTALFVASLSLLLSVTGVRPHQVFLNVIGWCLLLWVGTGALLLGLTQAGYLSGVKGMTALFLTSPYAVMVAQTRAMLNSTTVGGFAYSWVFHCALVLLVTAFLLLLAIWRVRRITITFIVKQVEGKSKTGEDRHRPVAGQGPWHRKVRPIKGSPIVWKELRRPWFTHGWWSFLYGGIAIVLIVGAIVTLALYGALSFGLLYLPIQAIHLVFTLRLAASAASAVTREKEARAWPILLTTPLDDREIVRGKAIGVLRRNLPLLLPLPPLYLLLILKAPSGGPGFTSWSVGTAGIVLGMVGNIAFLLGLGLYMSVRLKTTTAAVGATLGTYFGLKFFCCGGFSPLFLAMHSMMRARGMLAVIPLFITIAPAIVYFGIGWLFLRLAMGRLRRDVFVLDGIR